MPKLNTIEAHVMNNFFVIVRKYKFDSIRQEAYWATINKLCKQCKSLEQAQRYVERITKV